LTASAKKKLQAIYDGHIRVTKSGVKSLESVQVQPSHFIWVLLIRQFICEDQRQTKCLLQAPSVHLRAPEPEPNSSILLFKRIPAVALAAVFPQ